MVALLTGWAGMAGDASAQAQPAGAARVQPSFDCRRASTEVERAICADAQLAAADRAVARAYAGALARFAGPARAALQEEQRWFNEARELTLPGDSTDRIAVRENVLPHLEFRARQLSSMTPAPGPGLVGRWSSVMGEFTVTAASGGRVQVTGSTVAPGNARWICDIDTQTGRITGTGTSQRIVLRLDGWTITLRRDGQMLRVSETEPPGGWSLRSYCGANGFLEGAFFPVPPERR
jgi:uncharacterized protein YecT (DUF1311 family)